MFTVVGGEHNVLFNKAHTVDSCHNHSEVCPDVYVIGTMSNLFGIKTKQKCYVPDVHLRVIIHTDVCAPV